MPEISGSLSRCQNYGLTWGYDYLSAVLFVGVLLLAAFGAGP
jgi:hypothetical protein